MYEILMIGYDGRYFEETLQGIDKVNHAVGFVNFVSHEGQCMFAINADKLVSYKKID